MICPHCGCESSRVLECRRMPDGLKRFRACRRCGERFPTMETLSEPRRRGGKDKVAATAPALSLVQAPAAGPLPPTQAEPRRRAQERVAGFWPITVEDVADDVRGMPADLVDSLLSWWNSARRSRWGAKAVWTRNAWQQSVGRVQGLAPRAALGLAKAGAEFGWMALKSEYVAGSSTARLHDAFTGKADSGRPLPKDPSMLAAIDSWPADPA